MDAIIFKIVATVDKTKNLGILELEPKAKVENVGRGRSWNPSIFHIPEEMDMGKWNGVIYGPNMTTWHHYEFINT